MTSACLQKQIATKISSYTAIEEGYRKHVIMVPMHALKTM
jgi:hypothetical protein